YRSGEQAPVRRIDVVGAGQVAHDAGSLLPRDDGSPGGAIEDLHVRVDTNLLPVGHQHAVVLGHRGDRIKVDVEPVAVAGRLQQLLGVGGVEVVHGQAHVAGHV